MSEPVDCWPSVGQHGRRVEVTCDRWISVRAQWRESISGQPLLDDHPLVALLDGVDDAAVPAVGPLLPGQQEAGESSVWAGDPAVPDRRRCGPFRGCAGGFDGWAGVQRPGGVFGDQAVATEAPLPRRAPRRRPHPEGRHYWLRNRGIDALPGTVLAPRHEGAPRTGVALACAPLNRSRRWSIVPRPTVPRYELVSASSGIW